MTDHSPEGATLEFLAWLKRFYAENGLPDSYTQAADEFMAREAWEHAWKEGHKVGAWSAAAPQATTQAAVPSVDPCVTLRQVENSLSRRLRATLQELEDLGGLGVTAHRIIRNGLALADAERASSLLAGAPETDKQKGTAPQVRDLSDEEIVSAAEQADWPAAMLAPVIRRKLHDFARAILRAATSPAPGET